MLLHRHLLVVTGVRRAVDHAGRCVERDVAVVDLERRRLGIDHRAVGVEDHLLHRIGRRVRDRTLHVVGGDLHRHDIERHGGRSGSREHRRGTRENDEDQKDEGLVFHVSSVAKHKGFASCF